MAYTGLVPPRTWTPLLPTRFWVRYEGNALGDNRPVRITIHPEPFQLHCEDLISGLRVQDYPPDFDEGLGGPAWT